MQTTPQTISPSGRFLGRITLTSTPAVVSAGDFMSNPPVDTIVPTYRYWKFRIESDHLLEAGAEHGDYALVDDAMVGRWRPEDYSGQTVVVFTEAGLLVGHYVHAGGYGWLEILDGSRDVIEIAPTMRICGVIARTMKAVVRGEVGDEFV